MNFNNHSNLEGQHAFLGASKYHWINYGEDKVAEAYRNFLATQKGTVLHAFAAQCIMLNQKLPKSKQTLNMYVNDAIGFKMTPEQILYYSDNCFGTAEVANIPLREQVQDSTPNRFRTEANGKRKHKKEASLHREASFLYRK